MDLGVSQSNPLKQLVETTREFEVIGGVISEQLNLCGALGASAALVEAAVIRWIPLESFERVKLQPLVGPMYHFISLGVVPLGTIALLCLAINALLTGGFLVGKWARDWCVVEAFIGGAVALPLLGAITVFLAVFAVFIGCYIVILWIVGEMI